MRSPGLFVMVCLLLFGCAEPRENSAADENNTSRVKSKPLVLVTSQPLYDMAGMLSGDLLEIQRITPDGVSSRLWKPGKDEIKRLQQADLILISGAGYEPWRDRISLPSSRLSDTAVGYYDQFIRIPDAITHQHGPEGKHAHPGTVWATWLDPELSESQCSTVASRLSSLAPEGSKTIEAAMTAYRTQIAKSVSLATETSALAATRKISVVGDSPSYHYLTKKLGWELQYVHWDDDQELTSTEQNELSSIVEKLPEAHHRIFLLSTNHPESFADFATEKGFSVVRIDLCEYPLPETKSSFLDRIHANFLRINAILEGPLKSPQ